MMPQDYSLGSDHNITVVKDDMASTTRVVQCLNIPSLRTPENWTARDPLQYGTCTSLRGTTVHVLEYIRPYVHGSLDSGGGPRGPGRAGGGMDIIPY
jgi:hypothetical protein